MISTVQVNPIIRTPDPGFRNRIYYPVKNLKGPEFKICNSYDEFIAYYGLDSLAQLLYESGYQLMCHRVSYVHSPANLTKYCISNGNKREYKYYQDLEYSDISDIEFTTLNKPNSNYYSEADSKYSYEIVFNTSVTEFNDFYMLVSYHSTKKTVYSSNNTSYHTIGLFGSAYVKKRKIDTDEQKLGGTEVIRDEFSLNPSTFSKYLLDHEITEAAYIDKRLTSAAELEEAVIDFLRTSCALDVVDLGSHHYIISVNSVNFEFNYSNPDIFSKCEPSNYYYHRVNSIKYQDNKVISISTKFPSAENNITVTISDTLLNKYKIQVTDENNAYSESYILSKEELATYGLGSKLVDIELHNTTYSGTELDITGTYKLIGSPGYYEDEYYLETLANLDLEETDIPQVDIVLDLIGSKYSLGYLNQLFPWAILLTTNQINYFNPVSKSLSVANLLSVTPNLIHWQDTDTTYPAYFIILNTLPKLADYSYVKYTVPDDAVFNSSVDCQIKDTEYGYELSNLFLKNYSGMKIGILPSLAKASVYRICTEVDTSSVQSIENSISTNIDKISNYLGITVTHRLSNKLLQGSKFTATLELYIQNLGFTQFKINVEIIYE